VFTRRTEIFTRPRWVRASVRLQWDTNPLRKVAIERKTDATLEWKQLHEERSKKFDEYVEEVKRASSEHMKLWDGDVPHRSDQANNKKASKNAKTSSEDLDELRWVAMEKFRGLVADAAETKEAVKQQETELKDESLKRARKAMNSINELSEILGNSAWLKDIRDAEAKADAVVEAKAEEFKKVNSSISEKLKDAERRMAEADDTIRELDSRKLLETLHTGISGI
jgi:hypothetical protein